MKETIKRLAIGYGMLLMLAAGGLAFANIFGVIAGAIQFGGETAPAPTTTRMWMNIGWVFGVVSVLVSAVVKMRRRPRKQPAQETTREEDGVQESTQAPSEGRRHGLLASSAMGGCAGALLGGILGATFVLLWFSITFSPFAPKTWRAAVSVEKQRVGTSRREEPVASTNHPVALIAFGTPLALGAIAGTVFGGVFRATDVE